MIHKVYDFYSDSDTEVVLNAFAEWGSDCVQKFIGMFAFTILDRKQEIVSIFRDRAGVKPLYYYHPHEIFCFGSELKSLMANPAFKREISMEGLSLFLKHGYIASPHTIFKNTKKLERGCYLTIDLKTLSTKNKIYWDVINYYNLPKSDVSES